MMSHYHNTKVTVWLIAYTFCKLQLCEPNAMCLVQLRVCFVYRDSVSVYVSKVCWDETEQKWFFVNDTDDMDKITPIAQTLRASWHTDIFDIAMNCAMSGKWNNIRYPWQPHTSRANADCIFVSQKAISALYWVAISIVWNCSGVYILFFKWNYL